MDGHRTERHVHQLSVGDDWDLAPIDGVHDVLANQVLVSAKAWARTDLREVAEVG